MLNLSLDYKVVAAAAIVGAIAVWAAKKSIASVAQAVNPADEKNVVNTWFNSVTKSITGNDEPIGAQIYDWLHPQEPVATKTTVVDKTQSSTASLAQSLDNQIQNQGPPGQVYENTVDLYTQAYLEGGGL
jgi:hypothetical protein